MKRERKRERETDISNLNVHSLNASQAPSIPTPGNSVQISLLSGRNLMA